MATAVSSSPPAKRARLTRGGVIAVVNSGRVDYDGSMDWTKLLGEVSGAAAEHELQTVVTFETDPSSDADFTERVGSLEGVEVVVTKEVPVSAAVISRLPSSVKLLCEAGTGFNNVDLEACRARGITVMNVPAYSTDAVATLVLTFLLNFSSSLHDQVRRLAAGDRANFDDRLQAPHFELAGKTLGLVGGSGGIGSRVKNLALAFGMSVLISSRSERAAEPGVEYTTSVERVLRESDFVSLHCPLNDATRNLVDAPALACMKDTAYLINTARGALVDEVALAEALSSGKIAGAALDVQVQEPPPQDSPLYSLKNVILTPHIGWKRKETREKLVAKLAANVANYYAGTWENVVS